MAGPLTLASAGKIAFGALGLGKALFGGRKQHKYRGARQFSYMPNENDPELALLRRRALEEISRSRMRDVDEISRAGLLGSSAAFGVLGEGERRGARALEDIDMGTFARRRAEALELFRDEENFERQLALGEQQLSAQDSLAGTQALGDIGGFLGQDLEELMRKKKALISGEDAEAAGNIFGTMYGGRL